MTPIRFTLTAACQLAGLCLLLWASPFAIARQEAPKHDRLPLDTPEDVALTVQGVGGLFEALSDAPGRNHRANNLNLLTAIASQNVEGVRELLATGESLQADGEARAPIDLAIERAGTDLTIVRMLLDALESSKVARLDTQPPPMLAAIRAGRGDIISELLSRGAGPFASNGQTPPENMLTVARQICGISEFTREPVYTPLLTPAARSALGEGESHDKAVVAGIKRLMAHAFFGDEAAVRLDLQAGTDPKAADATGWTALHWAAASAEDRTAIIAVLKAAGTPVDHEDEAQQRALSTAAAAGNRSNTLALLLTDIESQADSDAVFRGARRAMAYEHVELAIELARRIRPSEKPIDGLWGWVMYRGNAAGLQAMFDHGFELPDWPRELRPHLLTGPIESGHDDIVRLLVTRGVEIYSPPQTNTTEQYCAFQRLSRRSSDGLFKTLFDAATQRDEWDVTLQGVRMVDAALLHAATLGRTDWCRALVEVGGNPDAELRWPSALSSPQSPLINAVAGNHVEIVRLFVHRGAKLTVPKERGQWLLTVAAARAREDMVRLLLDAGADPNAPYIAPDAQAPRRPYSPIEVAASNGNRETFTVLRDRGAIFDLIEAGVPMLARAVEHRSHETIRMLVELGVPADRVPAREAYSSTLGEYSPLGLARRLAEGGGDTYAENLRVLEEAVKAHEYEAVIERDPAR